ncbi:sulfurtransferase [Alkalicoccobacillus porphyridii]|uniref:Sulfurtransferase n=1 Tax=Alkalicoccobacillus porphyridii TaxID=2597270 RepID=A0A553ZVE3_9BACI|nr:sulfurtransferase [Alkalicoccobacillus porphyridii]TSB45450.1 sulfurtransferase [Alkalicoccobacillus porphyridii]
MDKLINAGQLKEWMHKKPESLLVVDVRYVLTEPNKGRELYQEGHIPGAVYVSLGEDLSKKGGKHGGRHPLPEVQELASFFGGIGIDQDTIVVAYDQNKGSFASRLWWQLEYLGHNQTYILEGGFEGWQGAGYDVSAEEPKPTAKTFDANVRQEARLTRQDVLERLADDDAILIDARAPERYSGESEPLDKKGGHIPGALNYFWEDLLDESGHWKRNEALTEHFRSLPKTKEIIVYCGSGVTACPNVLALKEAGFTNVKLYSGSWSDWVSYEDSPIEKGF